MARKPQTTNKPAAPAKTAKAKTTTVAPAGPIALKRAQLKLLEEDAGAAHDALLKLPGNAEPAEVERLKVASDLADAAAAAMKLELDDLIERSQSLLGSNTLPGLIDIGGVEVQLGAIVAAAQLASGLTPDVWNALQQVERDRWLDEEIAERRRVAAPPPAPKPAESQPQPDAENLAAGWVTVIGPVKGRRRIGRTFSAEAQSFRATPDELAELAADKLLAVTTGVSVGAASEKIGRRLTVDDIDFDESPTINVKVLGPTRGRRRAGFEFNASAQTVEVDRAKLGLILGDPELAVMPV